MADSDYNLADPRGLGLVGTGAGLRNTRMLHASARLATHEGDRSGGLGALLVSCWVSGAAAGTRKVEMIGKGWWSRVPILYMLLLGLG
jgi:hypothetical protein